MPVVRMQRIDVIVPRAAARRLLRTIHRAGIMHLEPFEPPPGSSAGLFDRGLRHTPTEAPDDSSSGATDGTPYDAALERLAEMTGILVLPEPPHSLVIELWDLDDEALLARATALEPIIGRASALAAERLRLIGEASRLAGYRRLVEGLRSAIGHLPSIRGYGSTGIVVQVRYRAVVALIREELESLTDGRCEVISADLGPDRVAAILLYPLRVAGEVRSLLGGRDLEEVSLPESLAGVPFDQLTPRLAEEEARLRERVVALDRALGVLAADHGPLAAALRPVLLDRIAEARVVRDAGRSDHLVVVGGWVPFARLAYLRECLARDIGEDVLVVERPSSATAPTAPVALENRGVLRAFEPLASFVSLPRYGTLDPTPAVALAFPVFVGLMVGDVGYGLVLLAVLLLVRRRWRGASWMRIVWPVGALAALSTVVFGVLFGECFGDAGPRLLGIGPLWFDRREDPLGLLVLAVSVGLAQVAIGLVLGIVNATALRRRRAAIDRAALLAGLLAVVVALAFAAGRVPPPVGQAALAVLVVALVVLAASLGLAGPLEVMGAIGNVLSYARLMAIGLASVMLAIIANRLGGLFENVLVGVLVAAFFHALNIALGYFDSSVQGLRLQYVEFFTKFVEPGGVRYDPFTSALRDREVGIGATGGS